MNHRDRKLLDLAHEINECTLRIPGVCIGYSPHGCEPCHGNWQWTGIGHGIKSHDVFAAGCHPCHVALDEYQGVARAEAEQYWCRGVIRTLVELLKRGWLKVAK